MIERKFIQDDSGLRIDAAKAVEGYASRFGLRDQGGDIVLPGAFAASLVRLGREGRQVRMLWQHDPREPIGIWDEIAEDARGLRVKGRILAEVARGREAAALVGAGALDGLSIGYKVLKSEPLPGGGRRLLELDLWEISLVTFPMLAAARLSGKSTALSAFAGTLETATALLRGATLPN